MSNALTISTPSMKLTKTDIINALVEMEKEKWGTQQKENDAKAKLLKEEIMSIALKEANEKVITEEEIEIGWDNVEVVFCLNTGNLADKINELKKLRVSSHFDEDKCRKRIKDMMSNSAGDRVKIMLNTPEIRNKLEETAKAIGLHE